MTIAVGCVLADGVVMGADSAVTLHGQDKVLKVYNEAEKLFHLYGLPVSAVTYGLSTLGNRTIGSYVREFEAEHDKDEIAPLSIGELSEELWRFLHDRYVEKFEEAGVDLDEMEVENRPGLGLLVGGFGYDQYLPELWELRVHAPDPTGGTSCALSRGDFGASWRGTTAGVTRFHKGFAPAHLDAIIETVLDHHGVEMEPELQQRITEIVQDAEYDIPFSGMPLQEGVEYVRFLLELMISQSRFVVGARVCGGRVRLAVVESDGVTEVTETPFEVSY